ncbi:MAG: hypothetical protein CVU88_00565 [Firmicutes bacterium HGW-Firmicutes-13]|nr:MAG: hypothetical protein CVU88_00565 [Firmicutes bacterium HGW-Firmicutes-13]
MKLIYLLPISLSLFLFFNFTPLCIKLKYLRENKNDLLTVQLRILWGIINLKFEVPLIEKSARGVKLAGSLKFKNKTVKEQKSHQEIQIFQLVGRVKYIREKIKKIAFLINLTAKRIRCKNFIWSTKFGLNDAAQTGILSGIIWSIKGCLLSVMKNFFIFKDCKPVLQVLPDFNKSGYRIEFEASFSLYIYQLYLLALVVLYLKHQGGEAIRWKTIQSRV